MAALSVQGMTLEEFMRIFVSEKQREGYRVETFPEMGSIVFLPSNAPFHQTIIAVVHNHADALYIYAYRGHKLIKNILKEHNKNISCKTMYEMKLPEELEEVWKNTEAAIQIVE